MMAILCLLVPVLVLFQSTSGQVCDWDWAMDSAQGLDPRSLDAGARHLSVLGDVWNMELCRKACCVESACQIAMIGTPQDDGSPECRLIGCMQDGRDVCRLIPSTQFMVSRKKPQMEENETRVVAENESRVAENETRVEEVEEETRVEEVEEKEEETRVEVQTSPETPPQTPDARSLSEERNSTDTDRCMRPMKVGLCRAYFLRYYYDVANRSCRSFIYGGCEDNGNNFQTQEKCEEACQGVTGPEMMMDAAPVARSLVDLAEAQPQPADEPVPLTTEASLPEITEDTFARRCGAEPEVGPCRAAMRRWFYSSSTHTCQTFTYGGCRGNENRYANEAVCMVSCTVTVMPSIRKSKGKSVGMETKNDKDFCTGAPESGPCRAAFPRFYYEPSTASCQAFVYGGCQGNNNRYETLDDCMSQCHGTGHFISHRDERTRDRWTPAFFLFGTLAVIAVLILSFVITITLLRSRVTRQTPSVSDKEELLPQHGEHSSVESLSIPESPKLDKV